MPAFYPASSGPCGRQWSEGMEEARDPRAAPIPAPQPQEHPSSPTRAGQKTRLFQKEFLCREECLLCHEQGVFGLGHALRRQEAGLRGHGWCKALRGSLPCGDTHLGEAAGVGGQLHGFEDAARESGESVRPASSPGRGRGTTTCYLP